MADVTISSLPLGTPSGSALLPYSTGSNTLGVPVSALFHNAGNIGIGTSNPQRALEVRGDGTNGAGRIRVSNSNDPSYEISDTTDVKGYLFYDTLGASNSIILRHAGISNQLVLKNTGNVGIGTATPTAKLDVNGDVKATNIPKFAWARFNGSGEIQASLGVTSITPTGPNSNVYLVDVTAANFSNANYSVTGMTRFNGTSCFMQLYTGDGSSTASNPTTTRFYVATNNSSVGQVNHTNYIQVMGN